MIEPVAKSKQESSRAVVIGAVALLLVGALTALFFYKWSGSLRVIHRVDDTGALGISPDTLVSGGVWSSVVLYFSKIWPALCYGVLIGAIVRATVSPALIAKLLGGRGARPTFVGAVCGSPLMLCSCCVTPVFTGVYARGARLGPSLSLMLASPGLNIAALVLTFLLMPLRFGVARLVAALAIVLVLAPLIGRLHDARGPVRVPTPSDAEPLTLRRLPLRFARSLVYMIVLTLPLIFVGVVFSAWLLPHAVQLSESGAAIAIVAIALAGVVVALPTFFEIPIAFLLLSLGAPAGAAVALLVAGPITNLPSLFVVAREAGPRVAIGLAGGVWAVACLAGLATSLA